MQCSTHLADKASLNSGKHCVWIILYQSVRRGVQQCTVHHVGKSQSEPAGVGAPTCSCNLQYGTLTPPTKRRHAQTTDEDARCSSHVTWLPSPKKATAATLHWANNAPTFELGSQWCNGKWLLLAMLPTSCCSAATARIWRSCC